MNSNRCPCELDIFGNCPCEQDIFNGERSRKTALGAIGLAGNTIMGAGIMEANPVTATVGGAVGGLASGGPLGSVIGALGGLVHANQVASDQDRIDYEKKKRLRENVFMPEIARNGGIFGDAIQAEEGEQIVIPTGEISDVNATKRHDKMKNNEVTDIVPHGSIIFSDRKEINLDKFKDHELVRPLTYYSDDHNYEFKGITVGDILGKKGKISFAEAAKRIKKYYPTSDEKSSIAEETNILNKEARTPAIDFLFKLQSGAKINKKEVAIPKAEDGWPPKKYIDPVTGNEIDEDAFNAIYGIYSNNNRDPGDFSASPQWDIFNVNRHDLSSQYAFDDTYPDQPQENSNNSVPGKNAVAFDDAIPGSKSNDIIGDKFDSVRKKLFGQKEMLDERAKIDRNKLKNLISGKNINNALQLGNQFIFSGLQSGQVNPAYESTSLIEDQYKGIPQSLVDQELNSIASSANSTINALAASGANPGEISSYASKVTANVLDAQNRLRSNALRIGSDNNKQKIGEFRNVIQRNNEKEAFAENHLRDFNNRRISSVGSFLNQYFTNKDRISDQNYEIGTQIDTQYNNQNSRIENGLNSIDQMPQNSNIEEKIKQLKEQGFTDAQIENILKIL